MAIPQMDVYVCHMASSQWIPMFDIFLINNLIQQHKKVNLNHWMVFYDCAR